MTLKLCGVGVAIAWAVFCVIILGRGWSDGAWSIVRLITQWLLCWGAYDVTAKNPMDSNTESAFCLRRLVRWLVGTAFIGWCAYEVAHQILPTTAKNGAFSTLALIAMSGFVAELIYLRKLGLRIPNSVLVNSAARLAWVGSVAGGVVVMCGVDVVVGGGLTRITWHGIRVFPALSAILTTGITLWYIGLIWRYLRAFREAVHLSQRRWSAHDIPAQGSLLR
jgi:hypothetical protein